MSSFFTRNNHPKIVGLVQAIGEIEEDSYFLSPNVSMFDLMEEKRPRSLFLSDEDFDIKVLKYIKGDFPDVKLIWFKGDKEIEDDSIFDLVVSLNDNKADTFCGYLVNDIENVNGKPHKRFDCDFVYFNFEEDQETLSKRIQWLNIVGEKYRLKIYGKKIDSYYYLGIPEDGHYKDILASTKAQIMFDDVWLYTAIYNNVTPLSFRKNKERSNEFSNINELMDACEGVMSDRFQVQGECQTYSEFVKEKMGAIL